MLLLDKALKQYKDYMAGIARSKETIKSYTIVLKIFSGYVACKYNGPVYLEEVSRQDLEGYLQTLGSRNCSPASKNHSLYVLRSFFNYCVKQELMEKNIASGIDRLQVPQKERVFLTDEEAHKLICTIQAQTARYIVSTLYYTGMRISECLNMKVSSVDLKNKVIALTNTKNKRDRSIPIHDTLNSLLGYYLEAVRKRSQSPYFFTTARTDRVSPDYVNRVLRETTEKLGWTRKVTCHTFRHSFASNLVSKNINIVNIQKLLGHSDLSTTSVYTHTTMDELKKAISTI